MTLKLDVVHFVKIVIHLDIIFGCLGFLFGKVINVFCFRTKDEEKETF